MQKLITSDAPLKAAILGASGYSGAELARLLSAHPAVAVEKIFAATHAGERLASLYPRFRGLSSAFFEPYDIVACSDCDVVFLALPSGEAMKIAPELLAAEKKVIDLSGDFRLQNINDYTRFYGRTHTAPDLIGCSIYGVPELSAPSISAAGFIANPGCYPTSIILPLAPLAAEGFLGDAQIVINSLSGVTGAGRKSSAELSFAEVDGSVKAYRVGNHQHIPEIRQELSRYAGGDVTISFTPHLLPVARGIYTTITALPGKKITEESIAEIYQAYYADAPFVRLLGNAIPEMKHVIHTNFIDIGWHISDAANTVTIFSTIDNLLKGAAGQAVQNMNLMFGFDERTGLL